MRVEVKPEIISWARQRSGKPLSLLKKKFPKIEAWETGEVQPTYKQLENFAKTTYLPFGYLFLNEPPQEPIPIPDCRTMGNSFIDNPSPDLLDTLYICQQRQEWYQHYARLTREPQLSFVGSVQINDNPITVADTIRDALKFSIDERATIPTWGDALRKFIAQTEDLGVMVMVNGVVGSNNKRKLDPQEFRGFALADNLAPLIFINGSDTKSAQMFTLAHEIAHLWLGESALSDMELVSTPTLAIENWCNKVAAELLVPLTEIRAEYGNRDNLFNEMQRLARRFKVSTLVILRRIFDAGEITQDEFRAAFKEEKERLLGIPRGGGGNFFLTQPVRLSKRFTRAVISNTMEGQTSFTEALRMLSIKKVSTFYDLGTKLGASA